MNHAQRDLCAVVQELTRVASKVAKEENGLTLRLLKAATELADIANNPRFTYPEKDTSS